MQTTICSICRQEKPIEMFSNRERSRNGPYRIYHRKQCKSCRTKQGQGVKNYHAKSKLKSHCRNLGLPSDVAAFELLKLQNGLCSICYSSIEFFNPTVRNRACLDHDHVTGKPRGILCSFCNSGLGYFKENTHYLENARTYLRRYASKSVTVVAT